MSETAKKTDTDPNRIVLKNVRLCHPNLFVPKPFAGQTGGAEKFSVAAWLHKEEHADLIKQVESRITALLQEKFKVKRLPAKDVCLKDGADKEGKDGYGPHMMYINASSNDNRPPQVVDRQLKPMTARDPRLHPGCRANVVIRLWTQDNKFGKKVNAGLEVVQWVAKDEAFGTSAPAAGELLDELPEEEECEI